MLFAAQMRDQDGTLYGWQAEFDDWVQAEDHANYRGYELLGPIYLIGYPGSNPENQK